MSPAFYRRSFALALGMGLWTLVLSARAEGPLLPIPTGRFVTPHARRLLLAAKGQAAPPRALAPYMHNQAGQALVPLVVEIAPPTSAVTTQAVHSGQSAQSGQLGQDSATRLHQAGILAQPLSARFAAVKISPADLFRLWNFPGLARVDGMRILRPRLDRSLPLIGATALHDLGVKGRGVMVAVVDTGIDFRHPDFRNADGSSRIAFLIDATTERGALHPELPDTSNSAVYTKEDIDAVLFAEANGQKPALAVLEADHSGHGTHVAGIAAGNGRATSGAFAAGRYVGVAPEATLCVVKATRDDENFTDSDILSGVRFCIDRADTLHMPVVVNLSLGSAGGPHDGTSGLELALDELLSNQPGRALCAASGNSGTDDSHASSRLLEGRHEIPIQVTSAGGGVSKSTVALEVYFDTAAPQTQTGTGHIALELESPAGKRLIVDAGAANRATFSGEGIGIIDNSDDTMTGLRGALVLISGENDTSPVKAGTWKLRISGTTLRYDVWLVETSTDLQASLKLHLDPDSYIEIPAAAKTAISVGAMRSRADWPSVTGQTVRTDRELGRVAPFSSGGPTTDGRFAPDILAPGEFIASALSSDAPPTDPRSVFFLPDDPTLLVVDDGRHAILRGTSQATPHVSGAVALLFELAPHLNGLQVRELLRTTADNDIGLPSYGPRRGFGTLDLKTLLFTLRGPPPDVSQIDIQRSDLGSNFDAIAAGMGQAIITVTPRDKTGVPLGAGLQVDISSDAGDFLGPTTDTGLGRYERVLLGHGPRGTSATVHARIGEVVLARSLQISFLGDTSELGSQWRIGGCAVAARTQKVGENWTPVLLLLGAVLSLFVRRTSATTLGRAAAGLYFCLPGGCSEPAKTDPSVVAHGTAKAAPHKTPARHFPVGGVYEFQETPALQKPSIVIRLGEQIAEVYEGTTLVARTSICSGRRSHKTPTGHYAVLEKIPEHISSRYGDYVDESGAMIVENIDNNDGPPPAGAVFRGVKMPFFLRLHGGIGMHAGPLPGYPDSHGCVRLPPFIAQRLFAIVPVGAPVTIRE